MERKINRRLSWIAVLLVVALLCLFAYLIASRIVSRNSTVLRTATLTSAQAGNDAAPLGDGLIYNDGSTLHALNGKGRQIWNYASGSGAEFYVDTGGVAAWSGTMLSLLNRDTGETLYSGGMEADILSARVGSVYAAAQVGDEHNSAMVLMERGGRQVDRIAMTNRTVLDFGFFSDGTLFWVMSLDTEGTVPLCSVSTYRPGKTLAGTITDAQQVLYEVIFQSSSIRVVGATHVKDFDYTGKEITANRVLVYGWYLAALDERGANPLMLFVPNDQADGTTGVRDVRMIRGNAEQTIRLPYAANRVIAQGDALYAFTEQYVMICRMGDVRPVTYTLPMFIESVIAMTDAPAALAEVGGAVYTIPMPVG